MRRRFIAVMTYSYRGSVEITHVNDDVLVSFIHDDTWGAT